MGRRRGVSVIEIMMTNISSATAPFDSGEGLKQAVYRCRKNGNNIAYSRKKFVYYNVDLISDFWIEKYDLTKEIQDYKTKKLNKIIDKC